MKLATFMGWLRVWIDLWNLKIKEKLESFDS
jgi:hypothetical protein